MISPEAYIHPMAIVEAGATIGPRTRVWAFAHILPGAIIGADCNICDHVFIENDVRIGDRVTVKCGVQLWDAVTLEDDVFIGPNATFTNDLRPRSKLYLKEHPRTLVKKGATIGANATIHPGCSGLWFGLREPCQNAWLDVRVWCSTQEIKRKPLFLPYLRLAIYPY